MERQWHTKGSIPPDVLENFYLMMETVAWEAVPQPTDGSVTPYATHRGTVHLPPPLPSLTVVQLNDGRRLIVEESMRALLAALDIAVVNMTQT